MNRCKSDISLLVLELDLAKQKNKQNNNKKTNQTKKKQSS